MKIRGSGKSKSLEMPARHKRATTVEASVSTPLLKRSVRPKRRERKRADAPLSKSESEVETVTVYSHPTRVLRLLPNAAKTAWTTGADRRTERFPRCGLNATLSK